MGLSASGLENVLPGMAEAILEAAGLAERAAGSSMEQAALSLFGTLIDAAEAAAQIAGASGAAGELAVASALLADAILQGRAVLACRQITAEGLSAARARGDAEGYERGFAAGLRSPDRGGRRPAPDRERRGNADGAVLYMIRAS